MRGWINLMEYGRRLFDATLSAFEQGVRDGLDQGDEFTSGVTYQRASLNEAYDRGVNLGQELAKRQWKEKKP